MVHYLIRVHDGLEAMRYFSSYVRWITASSHQDALRTREGSYALIRTRQWSVMALHLRPAFLRTIARAWAIIRRCPTERLPPPLAILVSREPRFLRILLKRGKTCGTCRDSIEIHFCSVEMRLKRAPADSDYENE